jgi:hypothetical protein
MKNQLIVILLTVILFSCNSKETNPMIGTWEFISSTTISGTDTSTTDFRSTHKGVKIINANHFSFLNHDIKNGKDSTASFTAGGGRYTYKNWKYTEHLEFCNYREWEGHTFEFTIEIHGDTLIQTGMEEIQESGIKQLLIEKYKRLK